MKALTPHNIMHVILILGVAYFFLKYVPTIILDRFLTKSTDQTKMVVRKSTFYIGMIIALLCAMRALGIEMGPLLGAAGILGVALGFASQTSVSNIISGLFLLTEKPFKVGDVIEVGGMMGVVTTVDLLSVKLRTFDNRLVRIANEKLIKSDMTNFTHYPIRRYDLNVGVAYKEDIATVKRILAEVAQDNRHVLEEPEPLILFKNFGNSSLDFLLGVWCAKEDFLKVRNSIMEEVKLAFDRESIEIAFPHMSLYAGEATKPFPITMISPDGVKE